MAIEADYMRYSLLRDLGRGTAFPASADIPGGLQTNDRFYRIDQNYGCYWDGTRWLTLNEYALPLLAFNTTVAANGNVTGPELMATWAPYVTRVSIASYVATTNNGSNFWTIVVRAFEVTYTTNTGIHQFTTAAHTVATWTKTDTTFPLFSGVPNPSNRDRIDTSFTKFGTPGNITINGTIFYRLILT